MNNKEVKNIIDNISIWFELNINWENYVLSEIDEDIYVFDSTNSVKFKVLDDWELFDLIHQENL